MGFHYQQLDVATVSALPPPSRYAQSGKVEVRGVKGVRHSARQFPR